MNRGGLLRGMLRDWEARELCRGNQPLAPDRHPRRGREGSGPAAALITAGRFAAKRQGIRNETGELVESFDPTHSVVFGDKDRPSKELVEIDGGHRAGQLHRSLLDSRVVRSRLQALSRKSRRQFGSKNGGRGRDRLYRCERPSRTSSVLRSTTWARPGRAHAGLSARRWRWPITSTSLLDRIATSIRPTAARRRPRPRPSVPLSGHTRARPPAVSPRNCQSSPPSSKLRPSGIGEQHACLCRDKSCGTIPEPLPQHTRAPTDKFTSEPVATTGCPLPSPPHRMGEKASARCNYPSELVFRA